MAKKKTELTKPKRKAPSTAFKTGNPFAFQPGNSGNPSGRSQLSDHLLSKGLKVDLAARAPGVVCTAMKMPITSSWSQVLRQRLLLEAAAGDVAAIREIGQLTEPKGAGVNIGIAFGSDGEPLSTEGPKMRVFFLESDGNGGMSPATRERIAALDALAAAGVDDVPPHLALETPHPTVIDNAPPPTFDDSPVIEGVTLGPE